MLTSLTLTALLEPWLKIDNKTLDAIDVANLELDSRAITQGDTFVAIIGHEMDGRRFIEKAIAAGASSVIAQADEESQHGQVSLTGSVPIVYLYGLDGFLSVLASRLYRYQQDVIGITGTNGKTTITQLIAQWIELLGLRAAVMGTTGNGFLQTLEVAKNTTGNAIEVQKTLASLDAQGALYTAMEVSSHGLIQGRVAAVPFKLGIFTNLSRDHLDYHGTMADYEAAKQQLFTQHHCEHAVINVDDEVGLRWLEARPDAIAVSVNGHPIGQHALWASQVKYSESGIEIDFDGCFGQGHLKAPLIGEFNACNVMLAFAALLRLGFDKQQLIECAQHLQPVLGRMELFHAVSKPKIVVDYAHTPDALEKALQALRVHCEGKLWVIVGCGGDRDKGKRPLMASIAEQLADHVILSDDNPRSEDPAAIVADMLAGVQSPDSILVQHSRFEAAKLAVSNAGIADIILLAGKGHEDYQVIGQESRHYSDRESAATLLGIDL
ncbi:UDP-N-acetylmuramoyl-L-alanyl-D-glutamate--2,6-diaminopimelate ligase [Vibrio methylphosphonaticus]|uniref:UDP-N-acetylmuramoyl-L-alanyl-D-glutamate--2, 6-diaminopimelate ligase n=1 Tax=Vibrio methylphosphonaticus TaxID=2946866 RepID=UPI00202A05FB|nr:UDP-N-acetylmuramoyl-L-alanyl-D-glutamate--2,6-diaminopimelate ligase [Vibrio methylphosphonaticus]MCL9773395.1 UDP-N-acetylmuramoyl-L-alanyl-D-glutamate--2,6-diaminopimelate ligase [Vibrio methylphosphonaticus]